MLDKTFNPQEAEARLYDLWEESGAFRAGAGGRVEEGAQPYCIVIPPPNVTGSLHMGHALNNTLQDVLIRFERMRGKDVLWQPGLDHAGIATQMIVERQLEGEGNIRRRDMGARPSSSASGSGRENRAAPSSASSAVSVRPATGAESASRSMTGSRRPC